MEWQDLIEERETTFKWHDEVPSEELVMDALREVYENVPSKNLQFPWQIRLYRNDDPEIRKEIMTICHRNDSHNVHYDDGNPQVLAPWLIGLNSRWVADRESRFDTATERGRLSGFGKGEDRIDDDIGYLQTQTENIEIGIVSAYIMLAMANRGIQTGMCQNIATNYQRASEIFRLAEDEKALQFRFLIGVGYGPKHGPHRYVDPRTDTVKMIPYGRRSAVKAYGMPPFEEIVKKI